MLQLDGLKNFAGNMKPIMLKVKNREALSTTELENILQFYLEVVDYLSTK